MPFFFNYLFRAPPAAYGGSQARASPVAYGGSQARGQIGAVDAGLHESHSNSGSEPHLQPTPQLTAQLCQIWATSVTYTTVHGNTRSLTHWSSSGIKPTTSWFLVRFVFTAPRWELQSSSFLNSFHHQPLCVQPGGFLLLYSQTGTVVVQWKWAKNGNIY